jgi:Fe-S cluster assembly protein SufD
MIVIKEQLGSYLSLFQREESVLADAGPPWAVPVRKAAIHRFAELGFPTTRNEEWKYTNVSPIARIPFQPVPEREAKRSVVDLPAYPRLTEEIAGTRLVFIDGQYSQGLSAAALPKGVKAGSLARALADNEPSVETHLARYADYEDRAFVALNTAFMQDGAFIEISKDVVVDRPIHLLYISTAGVQPTVTHPRNLIVVGRGSQVSIIEVYVGMDVEPGFRSTSVPSTLLRDAEQSRGAGGGEGSRIVRPGRRGNPAVEGDGVYFTNSVTEVVVAEGAVVDYCKVQQESAQAFHAASLNFQQERSSSVTTHAIAFGSVLDREDVTTVLGGEGAESLLHGLYVISGEQHVDNHTVIDHAKPHCSSRELYKGILDGRSSGVFNGKIIVRKDAQKTDSKQSNKNLLLSEDSVINTKPQLEIYADDVKCTHGATIGQIDQEAVFYMRSRGIGLEEARALLTQAFASDVIDKIKLEPVRAKLMETLVARLSEGQRLDAASPRSEARVSTLQEG